MYRTRMEILTEALSHSEKIMALLDISGVSPPGSSAAVAREKAVSTYDWLTEAIKIEKLMGRCGKEQS